MASRNATGFTPQAKRNLARIIARMKAGQKPGYLRPALFKIGTLVRNEALDNIKRLGILDTGQLRAATTFRLESASTIERVIVGSFGVKYARMNEFGGAFTDLQRRAMFAHFRETGRKARAGKGIINGNWWRARPYLGPAIKAKRPQILEMLRVATLHGATK